MKGEEKMASTKYVIGADLGGTTCKLGVFTEEGKLLEKWEIPTDRKENGAHILPNIAKGIEEKLSEMKIEKDDCLGVGIGVPGAVLPDGRVNRCVNLGWDVVPIESELSKLCNMKVKAANDANIAALGEYWKGGGEGFASIVMVTLGTGIGGGIVLGGKLLVGENGAAGEIGHIVVNPEEKVACGCGNHGCIEQYASATGIARAAREELEASDEDSVLRSDKGSLTAKDVIDAAKAGDALALRVSNRVLSMLGHTLAVVANTVNPEALLLGGGVSKAGSFIIDGVRETFERDAFHAVRDTKIVLAKLGNDAGIYGAAYLVIEN
ncbi:MAG: ROK family glucokinase [Lachnospiraceae bacterium]|nr:ROK family glucokinase [Lachnospiraceae bacterium]